MVNYQRTNLSLKREAVQLLDEIAKATGMSRSRIVSVLVATQRNDIIANTPKYLRKEATVLYKQHDAEL